jgi:hypothetical protein
MSKFSKTLQLSMKIARCEISARPFGRRAMAGAKSDRISLKNAWATQHTKHDAHRKLTVRHRTDA